MPNVITIGKRKVGADEPVFIIAEIGMNHNGDWSLAERMVRAAAATGVDAVKFQSFRTDLFLSREFPNRDDRRKFEVPDAWLPKLKNLAESLGIEFFSTPLDQKSADALDHAGVPCFKIASCDLDNYPFLDYVARKGKPMIVSTGFSALSEIDEAVRTVREAGNPNLILLHCIAIYPTPVSAANLRAIQTLARAFDVTVGFSDHTKDSLVAPLTAVALGAAVLEKHFTLDRSLPGYDHAMSETPAGLEVLVREVRACSSAFGSGVVSRTPAELSRQKTARRSLYWTADAAAGATVTPDMLIALRPGTGVRPQAMPSLVGRKLVRAVTSGDAVALEQINWGN